MVSTARRTTRANGSWEEDGYTVTRTYHLIPPPAATTRAALLLYVKDGKLEKVEGDPLNPCVNGQAVHALPQPARGRERYADRLK